MVVCEQCKYNILCTMKGNKPIISIKINNPEVCYGLHYIPVGVSYKHYRQFLINKYEGKMEKSCRYI